MRCWRHSWGHCRHDFWLTVWRENCCRCNFWIYFWIYLQYYSFTKGTNVLYFSSKNHFNDRITQYSCHGNGRSRNRTNFPWNEKNGTCPHTILDRIIYSSRCGVYRSISGKLSFSKKRRPSSSLVDFHLFEKSFKINSQLLHIQTLASKGNVHIRPYKKIAVFNDAESFEQFLGILILFNYCRMNNIFVFITERKQTV